jgi:hypothetical protein
MGKSKPVVRGLKSVQLKRGLVHLGVSPALLQKFVALAAGLLTVLASLMPASAQSDTCMPGYVWRMATVDDHVCVTPDTKAQVTKDNAASARRRSRSGSSSCIQGYVWRLANLQDHVCVAQQTRSQTAQDNGAAEFRLASATLTPPITPSAKLGISYPFSKEGCHHFQNGQWQEIPCASDAFVREHYRVPGPGSPLFTPGYAIQTNPRNIRIAAPGVLTTGVLYTLPLTWASVSVSIASDPTKAAEADSYNNSNSPNTFSIQNNPGEFTCSVCAKGSPFPGSLPDDLVFVQFYVQSAPGQPDNICVSQIDVTDFNKINNGIQVDGDPGLHAKCVLNNPITDNSLTGPGATHETEAVEVIGFVQCSTPGSNENCSLSVAAYLPWAPGQWWSVSYPDLFGLSSNWTSVSGTIFGSGGGSTAIFSDVSVQTTIQAYSCVVGLPYPTGTTSATPGGLSFSPEACSGSHQPLNPGSYNKFALSRFATVYYSQYGFTGENNNLTLDRANFNCPLGSPPDRLEGGDYCSLWFTSHQP